jgi:hypothetical protein
MEQALRSGGMVHGEQFVSTREASAQAEDDLGFAAALKFAIPAGLALWAMGIWGAISLFS